MPERRSPRALPVALLTCAALLAGCSDDGSDDGDDEPRAAPGPAAAIVSPAEIEVCGAPARITADVEVRPQETLTIRLVSVDGQHKHRIQMGTPRSGGTFEGAFAVPQHYDAPRSFTGPEPIVGEHVVRVERIDELLAVGRLTVLPNDPATPTTCHSGAAADSQDVRQSTTS